MNIIKLILGVLAGICLARIEDQDTMYFAYSVALILCCIDITIRRSLYQLQAKRGSIIQR